MTPEQLAEFRANATRLRETVPILLDGELRGRVETLEQELDDLDAVAAGRALAAGADRRLGSRAAAADPQRAELLDALAELRVAAEAKTLEVVVQALPTTEYRALLAEHPPRVDADGKVIAEDRLGANEDTIRAAIVRACCVNLKPDDLEWLIGFVSDRQMDRLAVAAYLVNRGDDAIPLPRTRSATTTSADE